MKYYINLITLILIVACSKDKEIVKPTFFEVQNNIKVSIISPLKDRDYSFHNNGVYGVYENPSDQKMLKGKLSFLANMNVVNTDFFVKWKSNIDGELFVGSPNTDYESVINTNLSKGLHKIYFEIYLTADSQLIKKDSITISNVVKLEATPEKGRNVKLNWSKYEGTDFVSYLLYSESSQPIAEINDINVLQYDYREAISLTEKNNYQVVVKTNNPMFVNETLGSNIVGKVTGDFISFPYYVRKMIKDPIRPKLYAIANPQDLNETADKYGVVVINTNTFKIESHILIDKRFTDLSVSPDGQFLYLTQRYQDVITRVNLNNYNSDNIITHTSGIGFENIEVANNNIIYGYIYNDRSKMQMINIQTGAYTVAHNSFSQGDMCYNSWNDNLYIGESNTSSGHVYKVNPNTFQDTYLTLIQYPLFPSGIGYAYPLVTISDDKNHIFWDKFQLNLNLNLVRVFNTEIHACSPTNQYLSDLFKVYDYSSMNVLFTYPNFGNYEYRDSDIYFIDENTIITSKTYDPNDGTPSYSYFFRIKV